MKWNIAVENVTENSAAARPDADSINGVLQDLQSALGISPITARVLAARGYCDPDAARRFLAPSAADLLDPFLLTDMHAAAARLSSAVAHKEPILLYGDYDVDGTSSVVLLKKTIDQAGGITLWHVPHRIRDGYGMKSEVVEEAAAKGIRLIVSVDTGIRANAVVEHANSLGIDVIVTDHHLPEAELPRALAVLNPNRPDCGYPEKRLCGAGVALKLAAALLQTLGWETGRRERFIDSLLKLAAIATVADVVPLTGENRVIVKRGLAGLAEVRNAGLRALLDVSRIPRGRIPTAREIAFQVAPRINAAGRMASASDVIDLFCTGDPARAQAIAAQLHELNAGRQQTEQEIARAILEQCIAQPVTNDDAALVFAGEGWHRGVVGIVASRIVERYHRPAFVLGVDNGVAYGSGRSISAFHLLEALETMAELFTTFGGHRQAAGVTIRAERVNEFRARLRAYAAAKLTVEDFEPVLDIDTEADVSEITERAAMEMLSMAPFGYGNREPVIALRNVELAGAPEIRNEKHAFLRLPTNDGRTIRAKGWNFAERAAELSEGARADIAIQIEEDAYSASRGYAQWQAVIKDVRANRNSHRMQSGR